jgi:hypothetical protein
MWGKRTASDALLDASATLDNWEKMRNDDV